MPDLEMYRSLAPFSARELVNAANSLLRSKPELELSERTLRYYVSEGLLPPPEGPTKFARYSFNHLVGLAAIRFLQDHGISLERIRDELRTLFEPDNAEAAELIREKLAAWIARPERFPAREFAVGLFASSDPGVVFEEARGYARHRSSPSRQDMAGLIETLNMQVAEMRQELGVQRHVASEERAQRSAELEVGRLHAVVGELIDALRELRSEVRDLKQKLEPTVPIPDASAGASD